MRDYIDFHSQCFLEATPPVRGARPFCTPDELLRKYDRIGVARGCLCPEVSPEANFLRQSNEEVLEICRRHPDRLVPFCNVDPRSCFNTAEADFDFVLEHYRELGCVAIGEMLAHVRFDDPRLRNLFAAAERQGLPVIFHMAPFRNHFYGLIDEKGMPGLERALRDFPQLVIVGHSESFWAEIGEYEGVQPRLGYPTGPIREGRVAQLMRRYPNLHAELSAGSAYNALTRDPAYAVKFVNEFADRLYLALDISGPDDAVTRMPQLLEQMRDDGKLPPEKFAKIMRTNAERFTGGGRHA